MFDPATRDTYVRKWINKVKKAFKWHWDIIRGAELTAFNNIKSFFTNYHIYGKNIWEHVPPPNEEEPHDEDENEKKEREEAPLNLNYNIEELEFDQQKADKSGKSFLMERDIVVAGRHRTIRNKILELSGAQIMRVITAHRRIGL